MPSNVVKERSTITLFRPCLLLYGGTWFRVRFIARSENAQRPDWVPGLRSCTPVGNMLAPVSSCTPVGILTPTALLYT